MVKQWRTIAIYVDLQTGEIVNKEEFQENYILKDTKTKCNVRKTTGYREVTKFGIRNTSKQGKLFG